MIYRTQAKPTLNDRLGSYASTPYAGQRHPYIPCLVPNTEAVVLVSLPGSHTHPHPAQPCPYSAYTLQLFVLVCSNLQRIFSRSPGYGMRLPAFGVRTDLHLHTPFRRPASTT